MLKSVIIALGVCAAAGPALAVTSDDAIAYIQALDADLKWVNTLVKSGDVEAIVQHSLAVNALEQRGNVFTSSEQLTYCAAAGSMYHGWWHAQLNALHRGYERPPGTISRQWDAFQNYRKSCLEGIEEVRVCAKLDARSKARCKKLRGDDISQAPISEELKKEINKILESDAILD